MLSIAIFFKNFRMEGWHGHQSLTKTYLKLETLCVILLRSGCFQCYPFLEAISLWSNSNHVKYPKLLITTLQELTAKKQMCSKCKEAPTSYKSTISQWELSRPSKKICDKIIKGLHYVKQMFYKTKTFYISWKLCSTGICARKDSKVTISLHKSNWS